MRLLFAFTFLLSLAYGIGLPLVAIALEQRGASLALISLSAAMPALGWLLGTPLLPRAMAALSIKAVMFGLLILALLGWAGFASSAPLWLWVGLRFLFGGAMGLVYRVIEYYITLTAPEARRGQMIGVYALNFLGGIILGSVLQPLLGTGGLGLGTVAGLMMLAAVLLWSLPPLQSPSTAPRWGLGELRHTLRLAPLALAAAFAYAVYEDLAAYLLSVYALAQGMGDTIAALTLTACALGALLGAVPMGMLSDRYGRRPVLRFAALGGSLGAVLLPTVAGLPTAFLAGLFLWAFCVEGLICVSLAQLADRFHGATLLQANLSFGMVYATGALLGPLYTGAMMQALPPHGLFWAAAALFAGLTLLTTKSAAA